MDARSLELQGHRGSHLLASLPSSSSHGCQGSEELGKGAESKQASGAEQGSGLCWGSPASCTGLLPSPAASSRLSPSRAQGGQGPRCCRAGAVEARAGRLLQNEAAVLPPGCPAAPW